MNEHAVAMSLRINGRTHRLFAEPRKLLSDVLREDCGIWPLSSAPPLVRDTVIVLGFPTSGNSWWNSVMLVRFWSSPFVAAKCSSAVTKRKPWKPRPQSLSIASRSTS